MRSAARLLVTTTALAALAGCYVEVYDDPTVPFDAGDVTLRYTFDGLDCRDAGVHRIAIRLEGDRSFETYSDSVRCQTHAYGATFEDIREDTYRVRLDAYDVSGNLIYTLDDAYVDVRYAQHREYDLDLKGQGGTLTILWTFDGFTDCGMVADLRVTLEDQDGLLLDDGYYYCDAEGVIYDALPHGLYRVSLAAYGAGGGLLSRYGPWNVVVIQGADNQYTLDLSMMR